jgi:acetolactate synthase regulatory subunit
MSQVGKSMKRVFRRVVLGSTLFFFAAVVCTLVLPFFFNSTDIINQTALQSVRAQRIAKDVLILAYRPVGDHAQAISEMQNTMPVWESEQRTLQLIVNSDSHLLVNQSQPDFVAIDVATNKLLAHQTEKVDLTQVQIILDHERNYTLIMNQLSTLRQSHIQNSNIILFFVQMIVITFIIASIVVLFRLSYQPKIKAEVL